MPSGSLGTMERVSVIIPTYNRWPLISEAVESVQRQGYKEYELVVVDDGSEDGTVDNLQRYGLGLTVLRQSRKGVAAARNLGASWAGGHYLCFLDSDDLWLPGKLETQMAFMKANPQVEICQTDEVWIRNGVRVNPKRRHRKPSGDIFRASLELCLVSPSSVMMTKELFDRLGGFDESFEVCEDYDLWLRVAVNTPVPLIPLPLTIKRGGHRDQLSRSTWGMDRFRIKALEKLLLAGLRGEKKSWVLDVLAYKIGILVQGARKRGKEGEVANYERILARVAGEVDYHGSGDSRVR